MHIEAELLVAQFPEWDVPLPTGYRAVTCTQAGNPTVVFLCEYPDSRGPSIYSAAAQLYERLKRVPGLAEGTVFYSVDRKVPVSLSTADGALLMPVEFGETGEGSWLSVTNFAKVAAKHGINVAALKKACLAFP